MIRFLLLLSVVIYGCTPEKTSLCYNGMNIDCVGNDMCFTSVLFEECKE